MQSLLEEYEVAVNYLTDIENQKLQLELNLIDYDSKETMTKLVAKLMKDSEGYKELCYRVELYKSKVTILDKKISFIKSVTSLFKDIESLENFVKGIK